MGETNMTTMTDTTAATATAAPRRRRSRVENERMATAAHEAGHAVVASYHGIRIDHVSLDPPQITTRLGAWGHILGAEQALRVEGVAERHRVRPTYPGIAGCPAMRHHGERVTQMLMAGCSAETVHRRCPAARAWFLHGMADARDADLVAALLHPGDAEAARRWVGAQGRRATKLLRSMWPAVLGLADKLRDLRPGEEMDGDEAEWVIHQSLLPEAAWLPMPDRD
jgi:hypothetical protein